MPTVVLGWATAWLLWIGAAIVGFFAGMRWADENPPHHR
jgi:hypothetical protein